MGNLIAAVGLVFLAIVCLFVVALIFALKSEKKDIVMRDKIKLDAINRLNNG